MKTKHKTYQLPPNFIHFNNLDNEQRETINFICTLHKTLNTTEVLTTFFTYLQQQLPVIGIKYNNLIKELSMSLGATNNCCLTVQLNNHQLGQLIIYSKERFNQKQSIILHDLVHLITSPLHNALQYQSALHNSLKDSLTNIGNRRALQEALNKEIETFHRHNIDFSLLLLDIDNLKVINDTLGHQSGDQVIKIVASSITDCVRNCDIAFRYGGDEFAIILSNTCNQEAKNLAMRLQTTVSHALQQYNSKLTHLTTSISIGMATILDNDSITELFERADRDLYHNKRYKKTISSDN